MFVRFCQMAASKAEQFSVGVQHCWPCSGERKRKKPCTSKTEGLKLQPNHLSFSSSYKQSTSPWSIQELKRNEVRCNIIPRKTKGYRSHSSHCKPDVGLHTAEQKTVCECALVRTKQQRDTMRTENTKSIFIRGLEMKASSGGCQSRTEAATTQLSVLRKKVTVRHRRLREPEKQRKDKVS